MLSEIKADLECPSAQFLPSTQSPWSAHLPDSCPAPRARFLQKAHVLVHVKSVETKAESVTAVCYRQVLVLPVSD